MITNIPIGLLNSNAPTLSDFASNAEGLVLLVSDSLEVYKRISPKPGSWPSPLAQAATQSDMPQTVQVALDGNCIVIEDEKQRISLTFTMDELRAIMRLFDVPESQVTA